MTPNAPIKLQNLEIFFEFANKKAAPDVMVLFPYLVRWCISTLFCFAILVFAFGFQRNVMNVLLQ